MIAGLRFVRDAFPRGAFWGDCRQRQQQFFELPSIFLVIFCFVLYCRLLGVFCFFVSICLLISNENSLLVFGFSACFCLCLPALFSALFQRRFRERKVVLPNRLSGRFFYFSLYAALFYSLFRYLNKFYLLSLRPQTERK